ncbi:MAG TPA: hypothetical protein DCL77_11510 [Prolixibacteraceae bacterium]|jgi:type I restriction enzyme S subunit|nr:hypothetical protein [Prolixibacteraceae bacterium]
MAEKNNKPEIRFKGFTEEWDEKKYSEIFTKIPNNTLSRAELNYDSGLSKNIHYGDVLIKFGELLDVEKEEIPYITNDSLANKFKSSKLQNGDVIIADAAEDETVGKCTEMVNIGESTIFSGLHTIPSRPILAFASGYLGYFMNSPAYHTQLLRLMQGTKVLSISKSVLQDTAIIYPIDCFEQSKIGTYYSHLDHIITLHQQKYNKLVTVKKAMLEKMFPQNGALVPEIRFKGFTEPWEVHNWKESVDISTNMVDPKTGEYDDLFHIGPGNIESFSGKTYDNILKVKDSNLISGKFYFKKGDIIYGKINPQLAKYIIAPFEGLASADAYVLNTKNGVAQNYLYVIIQTSDFFKYSVSVSTRTGMPKINREELNVYNFLAPNIMEQQRIGTFFKHLDHLITLEHKELDKLKNIKKACLEKMFV